MLGRPVIIAQISWQLRRDEIDNRILLIWVKSSTDQAHRSWGRDAER